jgi:site-specific recombinase XerD
MDRTALSPLLRSFERHLRAANRSERTIASYLESLRQAEAFLAARGKGLADARRADLEAFLGDLLTRRAAGTVATRYKVLRILYSWLEEEDEIAANPMARVKPPIVPEQPVPVVPRMACAGCWRPVKARASRSAATRPSSCSWSTWGRAEPS